MRKRVFISYRRDDTLAGSQSINEILRDSFDIFFDKDGAIAYGREFPKALREGVESASVVLSIIGKRYATSFATKADNHSMDYVLEELLVAKKQNIPILPILIDGATMPKEDELPEEIRFITKLQSYTLLTDKLNLYRDDLTKAIEELIPTKDDFIKEVLESIRSDRLVVVFHQDFTPTERYIPELRKIIQESFVDACYMISIPISEDREKRYFDSISQDMDIKKRVKRASEWRRAIETELDNSLKPLIFFITDIESGDPKLNRIFATALRSLKDRYPHFHAICIGRRDLAKLVYGEGDLSPLNTAKELFMPEREMKLGENKIVQQFNTLHEYRETICQYLQKEDIGHFAVWSNSEVIDALFWKNLLIRRGNRLVWRDEETKRLAREALECKE